MSSRFSDIFKSSPSDVLNEIHGITATYTPSGGEGYSVTGRWHPNRTIPQYFNDGEQDVLTGVFICNPDEVSAPSDKDSMTIDSVIWAIVEIGRRDPALELQLENREQRFIGKSDTKIQR